MTSDGRIKISKKIDANPYRHFMPRHLQDGVNIDEQFEIMKQHAWEELKYRTAKAIFERLPDNGDPIKLRMKPFQYDHVGYDDMMELCYVFELTAIQYESPPFEAPGLSVPSYVVRNPTWRNVWQAIKLLAYPTLLNNIKGVSRKLREPGRKLMLKPRGRLAMIQWANPCKYRQIQAILPGLAMISCLVGLVVLGEVL